MLQKGQDLKIVTDPLAPPISVGLDHKEKIRKRDRLQAYTPLLFITSCRLDVKEKGRCPELTRMLPTLVLGLGCPLLVIAYARPDALLTPASLTEVFADARPDALLARVFLAVVLADVRPTALLATASSAVLLTDARPASLPALAFVTVVLTDDRPAVLFARASLTVVRALCARPLQRSSSGPFPTPMVPFLISASSTF